MNQMSVQALGLDFSRLCEPLRLRVFVAMYLADIMNLLFYTGPQRACKLLCTADLRNAVGI